ncbi:transglutaminase-like domain-containing protein [soil metagenome]
MVVNTVALWLATAIAATTLWPVYQSSQFVIVVAAATALGSAIAILGTVFRWPGYLVLLATTAAYLVVGVPLAVPARAIAVLLPSPQGIVELLAATALSWKQLLTITLPVGSYQALLVPALILTMLCAVVGLSIALRASRAELATLAPVVLFVAGVLLGPDRATWPMPTALGLLAVLLLWLVWWRWYRRRSAIRSLVVAAPAPEGLQPDGSERSAGGLRTVLGAVLIIAVACSVAVPAAGALPPQRERTVLRSAIEQPFEPRDYPSPLSGFRSYLRAGEAGRTMLSVAGMPQDGRLRIATLDSYNGVVYAVGSAEVSSESGLFVPVPYSFDQSAVAGQKVRIEVTVAGYRGVWLPTLGKLESVRFEGEGAAGLRDSFYYNDVSGTAAVIRALARGDRYTLNAVHPEQPESLDGLLPGSATVPPIGVLPEELSAVLDDWVRDASGAGDKLQAMVDGFAENGYLSHGVSAEEPPSRSGHSADRVTQLLTDQRMIGDEEQYAVTAALMARQLGFPARVVLGFAPQEIEPTGVTTVRGSDVSAWIEVDTTRYGWVSVDPTPPEREIPQAEPQDPATVARPQSPVPPPTEEPEQRDSQIAPEATQDEPEELDPALVVLLAVLRALGWTLLVVAVLLAPFLAIVITKLRRRRRRSRAGSPLQRISGGWQEFEDSLLDRGFRPPPSATRTEVAAVLSGMQPLVLASVADRAVFAPERSDDVQADQVWRSVGDLVASLDEDRSRWQRLRAAISLRSLCGYSVSRFSRRKG